MSYITVKNFGPVQEFEGNIDNFSLVIGPQASGKSTLAKLIYFFKMFPTFLATHEWKGDFRRSNVSSFAKLVKHRFIDYFGPFFGEEQFEIIFHFGSGIKEQLEYCQIHHNGTYTDFNFSSMLAKDIGALLRTIGRDNWAMSEGKSVFIGVVQAQESISLQREYIAKAKTIFATYQTPIYVPAGRSLFTLLSGYQGQIPFNDKDFVLRDYLSLLNKIRHIFGEPLEKIETIARMTEDVKNISNTTSFARDLIYKIIHGTFRIIGQEERIYYDEYKYTPLQYASSGQQEAVWIALIAYLLLLESYPVFAIFEEPESHLYPSAQSEMIRLLALMFNTKEESSVFITTHSPYLLSSANNLIFAEFVANNQEEPMNKSKIGKIIHKKLWLKYGNVNAYKSGEQYMNIKDDELRMIKAEEIDGISTELNIEYDKLLGYYHE